jgi:hypothetical protein
MLCGSLNFQKTIGSSSFNYSKIKELFMVLWNIWKQAGKWVYTHVDNQPIADHNVKSHPTLVKTAFTFGETTVEWYYKYAIIKVVPNQGSSKRQFWYIVTVLKYFEKLLILKGTGGSLQIQIPT